MTCFRRAGLALALVLALACVVPVLACAPPALAAGRALAAGPAAAAGTLTPWRSPVAPPLRVVRGFEPPARRWLAGHRGVDLAGALGEPIRAAGGGVVTVAGAVAGTLVVAVRHAGGLETTYEPVRPAVRRGRPVRAGDVLGVLVAAGSHCPPSACLHWGLRRGDAYLDPLGLLGPASVRLLPLGGRPPQWAAPLAGGAASGSVLTWGVLAGRAARRRRRPPPDGVVSLTALRARHARRSDRLRPDDDEVGVPHERRRERRHAQREQCRGRPP